MTNTPLMLIQRNLKKIKKNFKKNYSNPLIISTFKNFIYFIKNNCLIIWICQILYLSLQLVELEI